MQNASLLPTTYQPDLAKSSAIFGLLSSLAASLSELLV